jgi:hypothetical protein
MHRAATVMTTAASVLSNSLGGTGAGAAAPGVTGASGAGTAGSFSGPKIKALGGGS